MPGFEFQVRRPLPAKEGFLTVQCDDGTYAAKVAHLQWPIFKIGDDQVQQRRTDVRFFAAVVTGCAGGNVGKSLQVDYLERSRVCSRCVL
jgi:hypothetical protein